MSDETAAPGCPPRCGFGKFGLIVTGEGEEVFLPRLFRSLTGRAGCTFMVRARVGQRNPIAAADRQLRMVGSGQLIPTRDEQEIGLPARGFLRGQPCHFVILVDDVEADRRAFLDQVFGRYRRALDTMLSPDEQSRASVHFLANMVEAYYFADAQAANSAVGWQVLATDHAGDVEGIRHPKNQLKSLSRQAGRSFDEKTDGAKVVERLDLDHVLANAGTCAFLRALFAWCVRQLAANCPVHDPELARRYQLPDGVQAELTRHQQGAVADCGDGGDRRCCCE